MIVLDASAAADMARQTPSGEALLWFILKDEKIISCDLIRAETASVFRKGIRKEKLSFEQAERYYEESLALVDEFYPIAELQKEAFRESIRLDHSVYDMYYFVLARRTGGTLFTLDKKLIDLCLDNDVDCVALMDIA